MRNAHDVVTRTSMYFKMGFMLNSQFYSKTEHSFHLVLEVVVGDVDGWLARFLVDEKIPPRKGLKRNKAVKLTIVTR